MTEITGIARLTIAEGQLDTYKRLAAEAREIVRAREPGTLQYDVYLNAAGTEALVLERYRDEAALMQHHQNMTDAGIMSGVMALCTAEGEILGDVSPPLAQALESGPVRHLSLWQTM